VEAPEIEREGIAINLDIAIEAFKGQIDRTAVKSGRLFDQDLNIKDLKFLDVGCGIGGHLIVLRNNNIQCAFGCDIVYRLVQIARDEFGLQNLMVVNGMYIPLIDASVDRVLLYNVIEHCSDPEKVLREIYRILSKNGILYMDVPNAKSMGDRIFRWAGIILYGRTSHIQKFTRKRIESLIEKIGFRIAECKAHQGIFVDYPQLRRFAFLKQILRFIFNKEINCWELKLIKKD
jgi:SAM-dependent methyltransferase